MRRRRSLRERLADIPAERLLLFLDFDGTLSPIAPRPAVAALPASLCSILRRLVRLMPVVIISGRTLGDLQQRVSVPGIRFIAQHGLLLKEPGKPVRWLKDQGPWPQVMAWVQALKECADGIEGAFIEYKGGSVALHYRQVLPRMRAILRRRVLRTVSSWLTNKEAVLLRGTCVLEFKPVGMGDKGTAVSIVLTLPWGRRRVPAYFGDDCTDRHGFRAVRGRGLAVRVGGRRGLWGEDAWLPDPAAVATLLDWLAAYHETSQPVPKERHTLRLDHG